MESALSLVCTMLYCQLLDDSLGEYTYAADVAGLSYIVSPFSHGIRVRQQKKRGELYLLTLLVDYQRI